MARKGPLRRVMVIGTEIAQRGGYSYLHRYEQLECGHKQSIVTDIYGETNAYRRRCWKCREGMPPDELCDTSEIHWEASK